MQEPNHSMAFVSDQPVCLVSITIDANQNLGAGVVPPSFMLPRLHALILQLFSDKIEFTHWHEQVDSHCIRACPSLRRSTEKTNRTTLDFSHNKLAGWKSAPAVNSQEYTVNTEALCLTYIGSAAAG